MCKKRKLWLLILAGFIFCNASFSQTKKESAVAAKVEALKKAMIDADSISLDKLTTEQLSYGHSGGMVENKKEFIAKIISGKSDFVSID